MISEPAKWWGGTCLQCRCCGDAAVFDPGATVEEEQTRPHTWRCAKHKDRNPCIVEGCKRTAAARGELSVDDNICGEHWRRYVPAGSRRRKLYHAHFRRAKKMGWGQGRAFAFHRFWDGLVKMVRQRSTEGHLDEAEINKLMGWDNAGD